MRHPCAAALPLLLAVLLAAPALAATRPVVVTSSDGYRLDGKLALPAGASPTRAVVLLHGSGPQTMDEDLSAAGRPGAEILFFRDLSDALVKEGFGVLRYHKRSHQVRASLARDPAFQQHPHYRNLVERPLRTFLRDAAAALKLLRAELPGARTYLVGHSQGCSLALQVARKDPGVAGVALIGFALSSMDTLVYEQIVYRPDFTFRPMDLDNDGRLDAGERAAGGATGASLEAQMAVIDADGDGEISFPELRAGNLSNFLVRDLWDDNYRAEEARLPTSAQILRDLSRPVLFAQGELDNQTPAFNARAVEMAARHVWKRESLRFLFFPGLGHALDPRDSYPDIVFRPPDPGALSRVAREAAELLR